jgi:hypothetical protein
MCEQDNDISYGYEAHDGREYGKQTIIDKKSQFSLTTEFVKLGNDDWALRLVGKRLQSKSFRFKLTKMMLKFRSCFTRRMNWAIISIRRN